MDVIDLAVKVGTGALGGAAASLFLAGYVAQRQERGKLRAADLDALRSYIAQRLSHLALHWYRYSVTKSFPGQFLKAGSQDAIAVELVRLCLRLSPRQQRRIRKQLVVIFGELTITCAEELAMTPVFNGSHTVVTEPSEVGWQMIPTEAWQGAAIRTMEQLGDRGVGGGSLRAFADEMTDASKYGAVRRDFEVLLKMVGGRPGLSQSKQ
ncbi:hypothetical protein IHE56_02560 [Streptomyces sp. ID01-12c]|uniref:hypothetical protein n=1 Tax=Streptomyces caniscabiei TaxID=2746961 RepID=UPI001785395B|nr:hypothetical protein [Streptomyces caniscabiei]MBD9700990.1 hypothetical protein [Streptomyces caniscabiei]MDX3733837.1 hypothetical protein [Streptomyces caniscabiei]